MCNFNKAWIGICKNENVNGKEYCTEHLEIKCSICGEQATHDCDETGQFVCGTPLCDSQECILKHYYINHGYAFHEIAVRENKLNIKPFKLVVSKVNYGTGDKFAEWANERYKDRIETLLMTFDKENNVIFYKANMMYYIKHKEEVNELFKYTWYDDIIKEKGVYYSEEPIKIREIYAEEILKTFEKVILKSA